MFKQLPLIAFSQAYRVP